MRIDKHHRFWAVRTGQGRLVCLAVYKKGALEVVRRLNASCLPAKKRRGTARHVASGLYMKGTR